MAQAPPFLIGIKPHLTRSCSWPQAEGGAASSAWAQALHAGLLSGGPLPISCGNWRVYPEHPAYIHPLDALPLNLSPISTLALLPDTLHTAAALSSYQRQLDGRTLHHIEDRTQCLSWLLRPLISLCPHLHTHSHHVPPAQRWPPRLCTLLPQGLCISSSLSDEWLLPVGQVLA